MCHTGTTQVPQVRPAPTHCDRSNEPLARVVFAPPTAQLAWSCLSPPRNRNLLRYTFLDESCRELFVDWEEVARDNVAILRLDAGRHPDDPLLVELVGELSVKSPEFRRWWADHNVRERSHGIKRYHHPLVGDLTVDYESVALLGDPDQTLCIYTAEAGSPSETALRLLASWTGAPVEPAG